VSTTVIPFKSYNTVTRYRQQCLMVMQDPGELFFLFKQRKKSYFILNKTLCSFTFCLQTT
jgi:hypothetical protein